MRHLGEVASAMVEVDFLFVKGETVVEKWLWWMLLSD